MPSYTILVPHIADAEAVSRARARFGYIFIVLRNEELLLGGETVAVLRKAADEAFALLEGRAT